jgi:transposase-like protein
MKRAQRYGFRSMRRDFPTDEACLEFIFEARHSKECSCGGTYSKITGRRQYQCSKCRFQIAPTSGTIFHKSDTDLRVWFGAILAFSSGKSGVSAKFLERELEVTYKTAWRMLNRIRTALKQDNKKLKGDVESDAAYFGGRFSSGKDNKRQKEAIAKKFLVIGAVERGGNMKVQVVPDLKASTHNKFIQDNVEMDSRLITDKASVYKALAVGYDRHYVDHHRKEYVRGNVHVNNIESFWGHVKRSMKGTHKVVSKKYLQNYLDGFVFHYNNRHSDRERFATLLGNLLRVAR